jgi:epoxyqueuosine reductase QueG
MAFLVCCMADFITRLGYRAIPMANDTALSIPLAIAAGMGSLGRNGMLLTEKFGACVRLCKVATDLPLAPDVPVDPPLSEMCESCRICADNCQPGAISSGREPTFAVTCPSNNAGVKRWPVDPERCYGFWIENGDDCSSCIASCPLTPR